MLWGFGGCRVVYYGDLVDIVLCYGDLVDVELCYGDLLLLLLPWCLALTRQTFLLAVGISG